MNKIVRLNHMCVKSVIAVAWYSSPQNPHDIGLTDKFLRQKDLRVFMPFEFLSGWRWGTGSLFQDLC